MGLGPSSPSASACPGVEGAVEVDDKSSSGASKGEECVDDEGVDEAGEGEAIEAAEATPSWSKSRSFVSEGEEGRRLPLLACFSRAVPTLSWLQA